ncbi:polyketide synthase [Xylaria arbuscula]|nr:polyketide synthase [Xylaria arbuscula]
MNVSRRRRVIGQGRSVVKWLVSEGARHFLLLSRSGSLEGKRSTSVKELEQNGAEIYCPCDIADPASFRAAFEYCRAHMPGIKGLLQAAMNIRTNVSDDYT